jgi:hypothetical protein
VLSSNLFLDAQYSQKSFGFSNLGGTSQDLLDSPVFTFSGTHLYNPARNGLANDQRDNDEVRATFTYFLTTGLGTHTLKGGYEAFTTDRSGSPNLSSTGMSILTDFQLNAAGDFILDSSGTPNPIFTPGRTLAFFNLTNLASTASSKTNAFFVSDQWRMRRLTIDAGVRAQSSNTDVAGTTVADDTNLAPRLGFSWDLTGNGKTRLFGNYGLYYDKLDVKLTSDATFESSFLVGVLRGSAGSGTTFTPAFNRNNYQLFAANIPGGITRIDSNLSSPYAQEYSVGVSRRLGSRGLFRANYANRTFKNLIDDVVPSGSPTTVSANGVSSTYDSILITNPSAAVRKYRDLNLLVDQRFSNRFQFVASYVYSSLIGNYSGLATADTTTIGNYTSLSVPSRHFIADTGLPDEDQQHRSRVWATYSHPVGSNSVDFGAIYRYDSGRTFRISATLPLTSIQQLIANNSGFLNEPSTQTIFFNDGETGHFDASHQLDASATFRFNPRASLGIFLKGEVYNLINTQPLIRFDTQVVPGGPPDALGLPTTYTRAASFGQARSATDFQTPRTFRFSIGLRF